MWLVVKNDLVFFSCVINNIDRCECLIYWACQWQEPWSKQITLIRQHLSLIKMNANVSLEFWKKSLLLLHGTNDWKNVVLSGLAMITEEFPPARPSVSSPAPSSGNRTFRREGIGKINLFSVTWSMYKGEASVSGSLSQILEQFSHCSVYVLQYIGLHSIRKRWGIPRFCQCLLESRSIKGFGEDFQIMGNVSCFTPAIKWQ